VRVQRTLRLPSSSSFPFLPFIPSTPPKRAVSALETLRNSLAPSFELLFRPPFPSSLLFFSPSSFSNDGCCGKCPLKKNPARREWETSLAPPDGLFLFSLSHSFFFFSSPPPLALKEHYKLPSPLCFEMHRGSKGEIELSLGSVDFLSPSFSFSLLSLFLPPRGGSGRGEHAGRDRHSTRSDARFHLSPLLSLSHFPFSVRRGRKHEKALAIIGNGILSLLFSSFSFSPPSRQPTEFLWGR